MDLEPSPFNSKPIENDVLQPARGNGSMKVRSGFIIGLMFLTACASDEGTVATTVTADTTTTTHTPDTTTTTVAPDTTTTSLPGVITGDDAEVVQLADREDGRWAIEGNPDWMTAAFGSLWVKLDFGPVLRVDPDTAEVVAEVDVGGELCAGLGAAIKMIWTCFRESRDVPPVLAVVDPRTNAVMSILDIPKSSEQSRLVEADGRVWIISASNDQLLGVDLAGNTTEPIDLGVPCSDLATDGETVYVSCATPGLVLAVHLQTRSVTAVANLPSARAIAVSQDLFVGFNGGLAQIDRNEGRIIAVYDASPGSYGWVAIADDVWVSRGSPKLTRIDPERQLIVEVIDAPELTGRGGDVLAIDNSIWMTSFDDNTLVRVPTNSP